MTPKHSANSVAARAKLRMSRPPPDYPPLVDYSMPVDVWTFTNLRSGQQHEILAFPSKRRVDALRFVVDGRERFKSIGYSRFFNWLTKRCAARTMA